MSIYDEDEGTQTGRREAPVRLVPLDDRLFWLPNEAAEKRLKHFLAETWANTEFSFLDELTPWEYALRHGVEETLSRAQELPLVDQTMLRQQLGPRGVTGRYVEAYGRSGGLLNLFNPWATEADDDQWAEMKANIASLEGGALAEAEIEIAELWNETANDLFSGLTPAHVWAGSGVQERELADQALPWIQEHLGKERFPTEGEALCAGLQALRTWQLRSQRKLKKRSPLQVILAERDRILARREDFLRRMEVERVLAL